MGKIKTYVITVSDKFPINHSKAGTSTDFIYSILTGIKIHTIREGVEFWKDRFSKIENGEAVLSIRVWTGKPYRSKQREILRLSNKDGVGVQEATIHKNGRVVIDGVSYGLETIANNDGLSAGDFIEWFKVGKIDAGGKPCVIIHFTKFRYK